MFEWLFGSADPTALLVSAARAGDTTEASALLRAGANIHGANKFGNTALHEAAYWGHVEMVALLLASGANVDCANEIGWTPLHEAGRMGHTAVAVSLLAASASMDHTDKDGWTPLHQAAWYGHAGTASVLVAQPGDVLCLCDHKGRSVLDLARLRHHTTVVDVIQRALAKELGHAIENGNAMRVRQLLTAGASTAKATEARAGTSPLVLALRHWSCLVQLLKHPNVEVDFATEGDAMTPLLHATSMGCKASVGLLLLASANVDAIDAATGRTALCLAATHGHVEIVDLLLADGANVDHKDLTGRTPLVAASEAGHLPVVRRLLAANETRCRDAALHVAIARGHRDVAAILYAPLPVRSIPEAPWIDLSSATLLGDGSYGVVYKALFQGAVVAVKIPKAHGLASFHCEVAAMTKCRSPYVLPLLAVIHPTSPTPQMVLPYMDGGSLRSLLKTSAFPISLWRVAWVIANALLDLHTMQILHRDVKSDNILLSVDGRVLLSDLGVAREVLDLSTLTNGVGTPYWIAPEVFEGGHYDAAADVYSFGVVLTELSTRKMPYWDAALKGFALIDAVRAGEVRPTLATDCADWFRDLTHRCLLHDPKLRPSASDIVALLAHHRDSSVSTRTASDAGA
ncbi:serine/threonine protein kinase, partial [Saprolegnia diclina VS20]